MDDKYNCNQLQDYHNSILGEKQFRRSVIALCGLIFSFDIYVNQANFIGVFAAVRLLLGLIGVFLDKAKEFKCIDWSPVDEATARMLLNVTSQEIFVGLPTAYLASLYQDRLTAKGLRVGNVDNYKMKDSKRLTRAVIAGLKRVQISAKVYIDHYCGLVILEEQCHGFDYSEVLNSGPHEWASGINSSSIVKEAEASGCNITKCRSQCCYWVAFIWIG